MGTVNFNAGDKAFLQRILGYIRLNRLRFVLAVFFILVGIMIDVILPFFWGRLVDDLLTSRTKDIIYVLLSITFLILLGLIVKLFKDYLIKYMGQNVTFELKREIYQKLLDLPIRTFERLRARDLLFRIQNDTNTIAKIVTVNLFDSVEGVFRILAISIMLLMTSPVIAFIVIISVPISYWINKLLVDKIKDMGEELMASYEEHLDNVEETISGIREIKALGAKEWFMSGFDAQIKNLREKEIKWAVLEVISNIMSKAARLIPVVAVIFSSAYFVANDELKLHQFITISIFVWLISESLNSISSIDYNFRQVMDSIKRIFRLVERLNVRVMEKGELNLKGLKRSIRMENVVFGYDKGHNVLKGISLEIPAGSKVAIVGSTGSGITAILNLLQKFFKPSDGYIYVDDISLENISEDSWASNISVIRQKPYLFKRSIKDNLKIANPNATFEEIQEVCKKVYAHDFIMELPDKYDSVIGEPNVVLTTGQKQRIAIARALLKNPKILIFDEATPMIDNESREYAAKVIENISEEMTVLIVASRLSTVQSADIIYVIDNGLVVGKGTHQELMEKNKIYKKLFNKEILSY